MEVELDNDDEGVGPSPCADWVRSLAGPVPLRFIFGAGRWRRPAYPLKLLGGDQPHGSSYM